MLDRFQPTRPTQFNLCKMHRHQIRLSKSRFSEVPNYEFVGDQGGKAVYNLYYTVRLPKSAMSSKGSLKVTVVVVDGKVAVYGIYLNSIAQ